MSFWLNDIFGTLTSLLNLSDRFQKVKFHYEDKWGYNPVTGADELIMTLSIVNVGEKNIIIKNIIQEKFINSKEIIPHNKDEQYNIKLAYGEVYKFCFPISGSGIKSVIHDLSELYDDDIPMDDKMLTTIINSPIKTRLIIVLTTGHKSKTKWIPLNEHVKQTQVIVD